jgi:hypothetical protein
MPLLPPESESGFLELNAALAEAREALLRFAEAEGVLTSLVCDPGEPDCRYHDLAAVRRGATVDELLRLTAGMPEGVEESGAAEATGLYPILLELAEAFDIFIDQHSLVFGDALALAAPLQIGWHAMAGCYNHAPSPPETSMAQTRMEANLSALPGLLEAVGRLPTQAQREAAARFERAAGLPWTAEARHLAFHAYDTWLPTTVANASVRRLLESSRAGVVRPEEGSRLGSAFEQAVADLLLARLVRGIAVDSVADALHEPFASLLPPA